MTKEDQNKEIIEILQEITTNMVTKDELNSFKKETRDNFSSFKKETSDNFDGLVKLIEDNKSETTATHYRLDRHRTDINQYKIWFETISKKIGIKLETNS